MLAGIDITIVQGFTFSTSLIKCTFVQGTNTIMDIMMKITVLMYHLIVKYINLLHTALSRTVSSCTVFHKVNATFFNL